MINARFEPVRIRVCVRFYPGKDIPYYTKALNEALKLFLAPWAKGKKPLLFGTPVSRTHLLQFLENLDYVDVVTNLKIKHFSSRQMAETFEETLEWSEVDVITPYTAASVLTTYLDRLNEDNPNVIDHDINVIKDNDRCACGGCVEDHRPTAVVDEYVGPVLEEVKTEKVKEKKDTEKTPATEKKDTGKVTGKKDTDKAPVPENRDPDAATKLHQHLYELLLKAWHPRLIHADAIINAMVKVLKKEVDDKVLSGKIPADPRKGVAGEHAYRIVPLLQNNQVTAMTVDATLTPGHFTTIKIDKPQK